MATMEGHCQEPLDEPDSTGGVRSRFKSVLDNGPSVSAVAAADVLSGMYAMLVGTLGIVLPIAWYTEGAYIKQNSHYYKGFNLYVFIVAVIFQTYISVTAIMFKMKKKRNKQTASLYRTSPEAETALGAACRRRRMKDGIFIVGDINDDMAETNDDSDNPETSDTVGDHILDLTAPAIYETRWGYNLLTRVAIVVFGGCAVAMEICRIVEYSLQSSSHNCVDPSGLAVVIIRVLFFIGQTIFLSLHHRVVFNYRPVLMKFALLHMMTANLVTWIMIMMKDAAAVFAILDKYPTRVTNSTGYTLAERLCVTIGSIEMAASDYLTPLMIGYCLLSSIITYQMYRSVGSRLFLQRHLPEVWETQRLDMTEKCTQTSTGVLLGAALLLATGIITGYSMYLHSFRMESGIATISRIHMGCELVLNIIGIISVAVAFYQTRKLLYVPHGLQPGWIAVTASLGGFFLLLIFVLVALCMHVNNEQFGAEARMGLAGPIIELVQITAQYVFLYDALRRSLQTVDTMPGRSMVIFLVFVNLSLWLVTSFQEKRSFGSIIFFHSYSTLTWILVINTSLPLAIYYRFMTSVLLVEVLRRTYGMHYGDKQCLRICCKRC